jgi:hypothetical protein
MVRPHHGTVGRGMENKDSADMGNLDEHGTRYALSGL